ncbi:ribonuclease H family protein [Sulfitobacter sp. S223]|uniref:ACT domain-containing protein n=1 Tax=Sulfitobacter sp. S223 TaxID=2867023 RepID=UPI0021A2AAE8|nr:ACT domain-containing protein [Sulfitobacter sp. S223]UWR25928.1 ribonuclease H family protein [Sulfitobacter sp. S223]
MSGETRLDELIKSLSAVLVDGLYVFVTLPADQNLADIEPRMMFKESECTTYIPLKSEAETYGLAHDFPCRMITLNIHSSLEAVGFMARIATEFAKCEMGVNPVSGFFYDHLFVPDGRQHDAMKVLPEMCQS